MPHCLGHRGDVLREDDVPPNGVFFALGALVDLDEFVDRVRKGMRHIRATFDSLDRADVDLDTLGRLRNRQSACNALFSEVASQRRERGGSLIPSGEVGFPVLVLLEIELFIEAFDGLVVELWAVVVHDGIDRILTDPEDMNGGRHAAKLDHLADAGNDGRYGLGHK